MSRPSLRSSNPIQDYYRSLQGLPDFGAAEGLKEPDGFFRFGGQVVCYGRTAGQTRRIVNGNLFDASLHVQRSAKTIVLPFDVNQAIDNLRLERYVETSRGRRWLESSWAKDIYYRLRPMLPVAFRKHLQKVYLSDWDKIAFPNWPVDRTVDVLYERLLVLAMQALQTDRLPFIWFWPDGHKACAIMTHDVETAAGRDFSGRLMDIDDEFSVKASFQIVPEKRYAVPDAYLQEIRDREFEVNVQGLDHEGNLFENRQTFLAAAGRINHYARLYAARGFRSPVLYRNADWFQELNFSYDMSVPSVARLEAQRGGCCTAMPYFLPGGVTELPLTTIEDYTLFNILNDYSTLLWKQQMGTILKGHGLMSFIIHPDYLLAGRAQDVYKELLEELSRLRSELGVWVTLPREVDTWWRDRNQMKLLPAGQTWTIDGNGSERARIAYACLDGEELAYELEPA